MASTTNADGTSNGSELAGQLSRMSNRTSLMVIDATLNALRQCESSPAEPMMEVRALARRMVQATEDFRATICQPAE
jgi:hypothetical protein